MLTYEDEAHCCSFDESPAHLDWLFSMIGIAMVGS